MKRHGHPGLHPTQKCLLERTQAHNHFSPDHRSSSSTRKVQASKRADPGFGTVSRKQGTGVYNQRRSDTCGPSMHSPSLENASMSRRTASLLAETRKSSAFDTKASPGGADSVSDTEPDAVKRSRVPCEGAGQEKRETSSVHVRQRKQPCTRPWPTIATHGVPKACS